MRLLALFVALRKESVDRNWTALNRLLRKFQSLSARRAWIEIALGGLGGAAPQVALRKESVDRNSTESVSSRAFTTSLSARRAWIEINYE